ncbi:hypothetical protein BN135_3496 [Cronobacter muytjensii 530]
MPYSPGGVSGRGPQKSAVTDSIFMIAIILQPSFRQKSAI